MVSRARKIYLAIVILIFLVLAPLLMLYSMGYRYDWNKRKIIQTGGLTISTQPKGASVFLNGKLLDKKSPVMIMNLLPKSYRIEIQLDNYQRWTKELTVEPKRVTYAGNIFLFRDTPTSATINQLAINPSLSHDNSQFAYVVPSVDNQLTLTLYDFSRKTTTTLWQGYREQMEQILWSAKDQNLLIPYGSDATRNALIVNRNYPEEYFDLNSIITQSWEHFRWDSMNENIIYGQSQQGIFKINLFSKKSELLYSTSVQDFMVRDDKLYLITNNAEKQELLVEDLKNKEALNFLILPASTSYRFLESNDPLITLLDQQHHKLSVIEEGDQLTMVKTLESVMNAHWSSDNQRLLYYNEFEIWLWHRQEKTEELLTRFSEEIKNALWYTGEQDVIFSVGETTKVIELDARGQRNIFNLLKNSTNSFFLDPPGENLYFVSDTGNTKTLGTITLR